MNSTDSQRILHFYKDSLAEYGSHDARSVHWSDPQGQEIRFRVLSQIANLNGQNVLDVGCGLGDLLTFFEKNKTTISYTGIDIIPEFIESAKEQHPYARFELKNIEHMTETFDYVLASGALSFKVENNNEYYFGIIKKMFSLSKKGLAFNMLNHDVPMPHTSQLK
jgi:2-polyprenyl-3-methyl-5-hydroxy-6-metoxy-1,4-benzoquinol methylase